MHLRSTLPTAHGPRLAAAPRPLAFPSDPAAARAFAADLDRRAELHLAEGRRELADRLAHAAYECRARAEGGPGMTALALDLGITTGWARPDGRCGAFSVRGIGDHGQALALFSDWIDGELDRERLVYLAVERPFGGSNAAGRLTTAMAGTAHAAAWSRAIPRTDRAANEVRKWLLGSAAVPGASRRERVRRLDGAVLAAVRARGFRPSCEHAADAAALLCMTEGRGADWLARVAEAAP